MATEVEPFCVEKLLFEMSWMKVLLTPDGIAPREEIVEVGCDVRMTS